MYGTPHDPTFNKALIRELKAQKKSCSGCRYNIQRPGDHHCAQGHWAYVENGPCLFHEDVNDE